MSLREQWKTDLAHAAHEGADLLDRRNPEWYTRINLGTLDMEECDLCILGQLYGRYTDGLRILSGQRYFSIFDPMPTIAYTCGFNAPLDERYIYAEATAFLAACWAYEIITRRVQ